MFPTPETGVLQETDSARSASASSGTAPPVVLLEQTGCPDAAWLALGSKVYTHCSYYYKSPGVLMGLLLVTNIPGHGFHCSQLDLILGDLNHFFWVSVRSLLI